MKEKPKKIGEDGGGRRPNKSQNQALRLNHTQKPYTKKLNANLISGELVNDLKIRLKHNIYGICSRKEEKE